MNERLKFFIGKLADYGQAVANAATEIHTNGAKEVHQFVDQAEQYAHELAEWVNGGFVDKRAVAPAVAPVSPDHLEEAVRQLDQP